MAQFRNWVALSALLKVRRQFWRGPSWYRDFDSLFQSIKPGCLFVCLFLKNIYVYLKARMFFSYIYKISKRPLFYLWCISEHVIVVDVVWQESVQLNPHFWASLFLRKFQLPKQHHEGNMNGFRQIYLLGNTFVSGLYRRLPLVQMGAKLEDWIRTGLWWKLGPDTSLES